MTQFLVRGTTDDTMLELQCCKPILMDVVNIKVKGGKKSVCGNKIFFFLVGGINSQFYWAQTRNPWVLRTSVYLSVFFSMFFLAISVAS